MPLPQVEPAPTLSILPAEVDIPPIPKISVNVQGIPNSNQVLAHNQFSAMDGEHQVVLELEHTSHFEVSKNRVWAWSKGKSYGTSWHTLREVELAFDHVLFLLIKRHILLRPESVLDLRSTFGGGAKARVGEHLELDVSRNAAPRLKVLLGI